MHPIVYRIEFLCSTKACFQWNCGSSPLLSPYEVSSLRKSLYQTSGNSDKKRTGLNTEVRTEKVGRLFFKTKKGMFVCLYIIYLNNYVPSNTKLSSLP